MVESTVILVNDAVLLQPIAPIASLGVSPVQAGSLLDLLQALPWVALWLVMLPDPDPAYPGSGSDLGRADSLASGGESFSFHTEVTGPVHRWDRAGSLNHSLPRAYTSSPSMGSLAQPWFLDFGHLVFWFFFLTSFLLTTWAVFTLIFLVRNHESRMPIRETRGLSRAQTGDGVTALIPLTWSITMLMHASTHSSNFDENTSNATMTLGIVAYQWGWNYIFSPSILKDFDKAPILVGRGRVVHPDPTPDYSALIGASRSRIAEDVKVAAKSWAADSPTFSGERSALASALSQDTPKVQGALPVPASQDNGLARAWSAFFVGREERGIRTQDYFPGPTPGSRFALGGLGSPTVGDLGGAGLGVPATHASSPIVVVHEEPARGLQARAALEGGEALPSPSGSGSLTLPEIYVDLDSEALNKAWAPEISATRSGKANREFQARALKAAYGRKLPWEVSGMSRYGITKGIYLPSDVHIHIICGSKDVIHSWAIPGLNVKIDCIPGFNSHRRAIFRWRGVFWGQCMEVCGRYHHWMPILVQVVHKDQFLQWCSAFVRNLDDGGRAPRSR